MQRISGVAWIAGVLIALAAPVRAQTILQRAGGVQPAPAEPRRTTTRTIIIPQREVIVIEQVHGRRYGWWKHPKYRVITVYYDGSRFYRRPFDRRALQKVVVYEQGGRYYIDQDQWKRDRSRHWGRDDRWRNDDDRRDRDRWSDDDRRRDHDRRDGDDKRKDDDKDSKGNNGHHYGQDPDKHKDK
jgi:hypothetical protein